MTNIKKTVLHSPPQVFRSFFRVFFSIIFYALFFSGHSQDSPIRLKAIVREKPSQEFLKLRISNDSISANDQLNEEIVDLVEAVERDTTTNGKWTTHQSILFNWVVRSLGYWWETIDGKRYKFVGTNKDLLNLQHTEDDYLTEHDVNFNLLPHTKKYQEMMMLGYRAQLSKSKAKDKDRTKPPYIWPVDSTLQQYRLHCELTPPKILRESLSELFYPCLPGPNLDSHPNFCDPKPTMGMYGPFVLDCNHTCHPEIHPYEWLWWLDLGKEINIEFPFEKVWLLGLMRESSNRFNKWSHLPRVGTISIPFIFNTASAAEINIEHLVMSEFLPNGINKMWDVAPLNGSLKIDKKSARRIGENETAENFLFDQELRFVNIVKSDGKIFTVKLTSNQNISSTALQWWLSEIETDKQEAWVWGRFNVLVSVKDAWTARIRVKN